MKISAFFLVTTLFFSLFLFSKSAQSLEDTAGPVFSNISVSASDSSATITWTTDETATTTIEWGTTSNNDDWDSSSSDPAQVTSHSVTISSLSAGTTYYYIVYGIDAAGNGTASGVNTFTTTGSSPAATPTPTPNTSSTTSTSTTTESTAAPKKIVDTIAPSFTFDTNLSHPYVKAPILSGTASDEVGVDTVEYSINGGANWIPAGIKDKGAKSITFSFSLGVLDDGDYNFQIRAKDSIGNTSEVKSYTLVIDRLPPQVGGIVFSVGPQIFVPTKDGTLVTVAGLEQKLTLSAIGGPTSLEVAAGDKNFSLERNLESGLWSGIIKFDKPGAYDLTAKSVDGAKNETDQTLVKVLVLESGAVSNSGKAVNGAEVLVHVFEPTLGEFIVWDGASYAQSNPQKIGDNGKYSLFLPSGKYYMNVNISSITKLRSQIFELANPSVINADFEGSGSSLPLPFITNEVKVTPTKVPFQVSVENDLIGKDFPFEFAESAERSRLISFVATWLPDTAQQIQVLQGLPEDMQNIAIVPQEPEATVEIYRKRGNYTLKMFSDPDGKLVEKLRLRFLPAHFFLDESGKIREIKYGLLSREEF